MIVDTHAHYVSASAIAEAEAHPQRYGVGVERDEKGNPRLRIGRGPLTRPVLPRLRELEERQEVMSSQRVDAQAVYTWLDTVGYSLPVTQGVAWSRLQNESTAADLEGRDRLAGLATVPMQSGERAADELTHAVENLGLKGVVVASNVMGRNLDDAEFEPFWERAEALRAPVVIHPVHVAGRERMESYLLHNLVGNPLDTTIAAACLMFGGVVDRHPDLEVVLVHGGGCLPYLIGRLQWGRKQYPRQVGEGARKMPVDYLTWYHYDTLLYHRANIRHLVDMVGSERVVLGTDYPFLIGDPDPVGTVEGAGLGAGAQGRILETNAKALFSLWRIG